MLISRLIRTQLIIFSILTVLALLVLGLYFLRLPTAFGIGQYKLTAELPASGGLYRTANVTYRGAQIGKVTDVQPTEKGARAVMSISKKFKIPADSVANVHSVSAIGEQYVDLVSAGNPNQFFKNGDTVTKGTVPTPVGPTLDKANAALAGIPANKIPQLLTETSLAVGDLGPTLQRLVEATNSLAGELKDHTGDFVDVIRNAGPILNSQVVSGDAIRRWAANLNSITSQVAGEDAGVRSAISNAAPTAEALNTVFSDVRESLPQTLANVSIITDLLKRYNKGLEQVLVIFPQGAAAGQTVGAPYEDAGQAVLDFGLTINQPPPCLTGFLPASEWRSFDDLRPAPIPNNLYCKIPQQTPSNSVRGARNFPCFDVPGKRAASPQESRSNEPYTPLGTNPWYGDPNQIVNCPAPGARCDQPVNPGTVIPAPSINTGLNPLAAEFLPPPAPAASDAPSVPGSGSVQCASPAAGVDIRGVQPGWPQPGTCNYTPSAGAAVYNAQSGELSSPDGTKYSVKNSTSTGDDGWKEMLAPAS